MSGLKLLKFISVLTMAVSLLSSCLFTDTGQRYASPEDALKHDYSTPIQRIVAVETRGNVSLVFYTVNDYTVNYKYIIRDGQGWINPLGRPVSALHFCENNTGGYVHYKTHTIS